MFHTALVHLLFGLKRILELSASRKFCETLPVIAYWAFGSWQVRVGQQARGARMRTNESVKQASKPCITIALHTPLGTNLWEKYSGGRDLVVNDLFPK